MELHHYSLISASAEQQQIHRRHIAHCTMCFIGKPEVSSETEFIIDLFLKKIEVAKKPLPVSHRESRSVYDETSPLMTNYEEV